MSSTLALDRPVRHRNKPAQDSSSPDRSQVLNYKYSLEEIQGQPDLKYFSLNYIVPKEDVCALEYSKITKSCFALIKKLIESADSHPQLKHLSVLNNLDLETLLSAPSSLDKNAFAYNSENRKDIVFTNSLIDCLYKDTEPRKAFEQFFAVLLHEACHHAWRIQCSKAGADHLIQNSKLQEEFCDLQVQVLFLLGMRPSAGADALKKITAEDADFSVNPFSPYLRNPTRFALIESLATTLQPLNVSDASNPATAALQSEVAELSVAMSDLVKGAISRIRVTSHIEDYFEKTNFAKLNFVQQIKVINDLFNTIPSLNSSEYSAILSKITSLKKDRHCITADDPELTKLTKNFLANCGSDHESGIYKKLRRQIKSQIIPPEGKSKWKGDIGVIYTHRKLIKDFLGCKNASEIFAANRQFAATYGLDGLLRDSPIIHSRFKNLFRSCCSDIESEILNGSVVELPHAQLVRAIDLPYEQKAALMTGVKDSHISMELNYLNYATRFLNKFHNNVSRHNNHQTPEVVEICKHKANRIPRLEELFSPDYTSIVPAEIIRIKPASLEPQDLQLCLAQERKYFQSFTGKVDQALSDLAQMSDSDPKDFIKAFKTKFKNNYVDLLSPHPTFLSIEERRKVDPCIKLAAALTDKIQNLMERYPEDALQLASLLSHADNVGRGSEAYKNTKIVADIKEVNPDFGIPADHPFILFHKQQLEDKESVVDYQLSSLSINCLLNILTDSNYKQSDFLSVNTEHIFAGSRNCISLEDLAEKLPRFKIRSGYANSLYQNNKYIKDSLILEREDIISQHLNKFPDQKISAKTAMELFSMAGEELKVTILERIDISLILTQDLRHLTESYCKLTAIGYFNSYPDSVEPFENAILEKLNSADPDAPIFARELIKQANYYPGDAVLGIENPRLYSCAFPISYHPPAFQRELEKKIIEIEVKHLSRHLESALYIIEDRSYRSGHPVDTELHEFIKIRSLEYHEIPLRYHKAIFEEFAEEICAQRETSYLMKSLLQKKADLRKELISEVDSKSINLAGQAIEDLTSVFRYDQELCKAYLDFFTSPFDNKLLEELLVRSKHHSERMLEIFATLNGGKDSSIDLTRKIPDEFRGSLKNIKLKRLFILTHERLQHASYEQRALFLRIASANNPNQSDSARLRGFFNLVKDRLIDPQHPQAKLTTDLLSAYIKQGWEGNLNQSALVLCGFLGSKLDKTKNTDNLTELGLRLAKFLLNHGEAGRKICQRIHSIPGLDPKFTAAFAHTKEDSIKMSRWDLFDLIDSYGPGDLEQVHVGGARFASLNASVPLNYPDGSESMLSVLMPGARMRAISWLNNFESVIAELSKDYPTLEYLRPIIAEARETIFEETDYSKSVFRQQEIADQQIDGLKMRFPELSIDFETAKLIRASATSKGTPDTDSGYRECTFCRGISFNEMKKEIAEAYTEAMKNNNRSLLKDVKREIELLKKLAMANITQVMRDVAAGKYLDSDSHGSQQKIRFSADSSQITIGRFDFGCMSTKLPSLSEQLAAADCIVESLTKTLPAIAKNILKLRGPKSSESFIKEFSKRLAEQVNDRSYISKIQTALSALGDFTCINLTRPDGRNHKVQLLSASEALNCIDAALISSESSPLVDSIKDRINGNRAGKAGLFLAKKLLSSKNTPGVSKQ